MKKTSFGWFALNLSLTLGLSLLAPNPAGGAPGEPAGGGARAAGIAGPLLNINFTAASNGLYVIKKGGAAVGVADDDFWNVYSRDDGSGGFATDGILRELRYADQQPSGATLVVSNAPGAWMNGTSDPMFNLYLYPLAGGEIRVLLTQLVPGKYDFYIYGHGAVDNQNGVYEVVSGGTHYGTKATTTGPSWISPKMVEGLQYVRFEDVRVTANAPVSITAKAGASGYALINGMQILAKTEAAGPDDGIPAAWRVKYFGAADDPRAVATADPDADGANNYQEYLSGTNPLDERSVGLEPLTIKTYAGSEAGGRDGTLADATFTSPVAVRRDPLGRLWVCEATWTGWTQALVGGHRIRVIDPAAGTVTTLAGSAEPGYVDGPAASARLTTPVAVVFDRQGNAFITERLGHRLRKIDRNGVVSTFAGSQAGNRDGRGANAMFHTPGGTVIDANDNLYVADFDNHSIRKITPDGSVTTFAGNGPGDVDGEVKTARFGCNYLALKCDGTLFVADWVNGKIRRISPAGQVTTLLAGLRYVEDVTIDAADHLYVSLPDGPVLNAYDLQGQLLWSLAVNNGFRDGPVAEAMAGRFNDLEFLPGGQVLFPDGANHRIRRLTLGPPALLTVAPAGGPFTNAMQPRLATIVTNGLIRYTLDGSEPVKSSTLYGGPLILTSSATVKARVFVNGLPVSAIATADFERRDAGNPADGIAGEWRVKYFGSVTDPRALATADPDGDGAINYQEFLLGTHPLDANSTPRLPVAVSTYAGTIEGTNDGYRTRAQFNAGAGVTIAPDGSYWVWESNVIDYDVAGPGKHAIRIIDTNGMVTTLAGNESRVVDGPLNVARFASPSGLVFDSHGDAFVSDRMGHRVRKISQGVVTTLAGSTRGYRDGVGSHAQFGLLASIAIDAKDNLFVAEFDNLRIRKITPTGIVTTYAGGTRGNQDGDRLDAGFNGPAILAFDKPGNLFLSDWANHSLRKISTDGMVSTFKNNLTYVWDLSIDADNHVYTFASGESREYVYGPDGRLLWTLPAGAQGTFDSTWDGPLATAKIGRVGAVNFLKNGDLLFTDGPRVRILRMAVPPLLTVDAPTGAFTNTLTVRLSTVVSNGVIRYTLDGTEPGVNATPYGNPLVFTQTTTLAARVFVNGTPVSAIWTGRFTRADGGSRITYLPSPVMVSTLAGNGQAGSINAVGSQARFNYPNGGATDPQGNTYIADFGNHRIRKITPRGVVTTVAGAGVVGYVDGPAITARFNGPLAVLASPSGNFYVADTGNNRIRKIDTNGLVTTVAGDGTAGYRDGSGAMARFNFPTDLLLGRDGRLYVSEFNNHTVRRVDANGTVSTLAGNGSPGYVDGAAAAARFNRPSGLALEPDGGILVSEWDGNRIRRLGVDNLVSTVAGTGVAGYADDTALSAQFRSPDGLAVGSDGAIYVADNGNHAIRCVQRNGLVVTVAGTGDSGFLDGRGSLARFASPSGLGIDAAGNLVVPDYANHRVRKITLTPPIPVALALRTLPAVYRPGVVATLPVSLTVTPPTGTSAYAVEDRLPEGWTIGPLIGDGGQYDAVHRTVKFGPFVDGLARTLTYEAQSSVNSQGVARFAGSVSVDGNLIPIGGASEITPSLLHPADISLADNRLSIGELTAYGAAWKRGSLWTTPPNPIPISYVTRAAYLWKNGEVYAYDSQPGEPPLCWVSGAGGVGGWGLNLEPRLYPMADPLPGTPMGSKPSGWLPLILDENEASAIMLGQYQPGQPVPVDLTVTPLSGVMVYAIEDTVPEGWSVASISGDGNFDAVAGKLKWGPYFDDTPRRVSYAAVPPADATSLVSFAGTASFDGVNVKIGGQRQAVPGTVAVPAALTLRTAADGSLSLLLGGQAGGVYRIEISEDLLLWRLFATVTNDTGAVDLSAGAEGKPTQRFYRVVTVP